MTQDMHVYGFKKRATREMNRSTHTLSILLEQLRSSLGAGKEQLRSSLEAGKRQSGVRLVANEITSRRQRDYGSSLTRLRLVIITLLALMTLGATNAWAQVTDYSGTYCIANNNQGNFLGNGNDGNFYFCPSQEYYDDGSVITDDNGKPFFTTYQTKQGANSLWVFEKVDGQNYYTIKLYGTSKYVTVNNSLSGYSKAHRKRIHLEELAELSDRNYFEITPIHVIDGVSGVSISCLDKYKPSGTNNKYFNPAGGNQPSYTSTNNKENPWSGGMVGFFTIGKTSGDDRGSVWFLEIPKPTITYDDETGNVTITAVGDLTIRYAFDEESPTSTSGEIYSTPISMAGHTSIKAIAVRTSDSKVSGVATMDMIDFTYHILTLDKTVAAQATKKQPAGMPFSVSGYINLPAAIQSPYISDETLTFYTMEGEFNAANLNEEHHITETPTETANIYVTYTTTKLEEKFVKLSGSSPFNLKNTSNQYIYDSGSNISAETNSTTNAKEYVTDRQYLWYFYNSDPYNIQIKNAQTGKYLSTTGSAPALSDSPVTFVLVSKGDVDASHEQITLMNLSTGETITLTANTVELPVHYKLIDRSGNVIEDAIDYVPSQGFGLPSAWRSPLAEYHYWNADAFEDDSPYTLKSPAPSEITSATETKEDNIIYVTYDVNDDIDLDGRNLLNNPGKTDGTTYMLQFQTPDTDEYKFYQEDGKDGVMTEKRRAVYPYSNGDATLYVYGNERWNAQLESGASTRTRWLWYLEPSTSKLDPYHVRISSYQTQTSYKVSDTETRNFHSYLRTYKPTGYDAIVTGVTNDNPLIKGEEFAASDPDNSLATEYMILGTSLGSLKLQTVEKIDGSRRIVTSFEQYWKNSPTVQEQLTNKVTDVGRKVELTSTQKSEIEAKKWETDTDPWGWHVYKAWANSAPWVHNHDEATTGGLPTTSKKFLEEEHVFQTISMGDGSFQLVPTEIKPMLILLDQHGWEIVRLPLPSGPTDPKRAEIYANIHKYSSPMVARYHFWKTGSKVPGYHKFNVSDYATVSATDLTEYTADELGRADITNPLTPPNLPNYESQALVGGKERDWYVTYDVKPEYANLYAGAAKEDETSASPFLIKQGDNYAQNSGDALTSTTLDTSAESIPTSYQWYLRPNFNIDSEMGYQYEGQNEEKTKNETEAEYVAAGKNGFDPYNVQIRSVSNTNRYFTANTTGSAVAAFWTGTSSTISLENLGKKQDNITGLDQVQMNITNATFMVIDDGAGNMRLMPRFDHTKVMQSFTTLVAPAAANTASQIVEFTIVPVLVHNSSKIVAMGGAYILADDFTASGSIGTADNPFKGTIEGRLDKSFNVTAPFVAYAEDAVIKNVIIDNAYITSGNAEGDAGAIVATAKGNTRVYNCGVNGGSVSGSRHVGSIVGHIEGYSRVINCYSYAEVSGGEWAAGIVGYNDYSSTQTNLRTMVMNCMFYGNVTGGSISPIYGGYIIDNDGSKNGLNNFNYFSAEDFTSTVTKYNCALGAEKRFLTRFEFYRQILNSNRELAAWYATGTTANARNVMAKWVLETADRNIADPKPYPVLKSQGYYPSIINYDVENAPDSVSVGRNHGGKLGKTLIVHIAGVGSNAPTGAKILRRGPITLQRTDKDYDHFNFNYDKVQLPYYNDVGTGNYTKNRVVTGWKITSITGGTAGSYTTGDDATTDADGNITSAPYNFADRNCTNKDLYTVSGRVFNQGAYWDVPKGVTGITIEPYWAEAVYLADSHADVVYSTTMTNHYNVPNVGGGEIYKNGSKYNIAGDSQEVYTSMDEARKKITTGKTVYDCAIVLVGNAHNIGVPSAEENRAYTIMSADFDHDNEPDYSYILRFNGRTECHPVRTDFVNIPGLGMAQKSTGGTGSYNFGILIPKGWFESTNTSLFRFTQFEYEHSSHPADAPLILQGGVMEQWVSNNQKGTSNKIPYIHVGGNVWFKEFHTGCHQDKQIATKHSPISVTGGDYDEFYLTGLYRGDVGNKEDNAECYINGGRFGTVCGAAMEGIGKANGANNTGNIVWQIQNADIHEFYAGGLNAAKPVTGNLSTTITDSYVDIFCGGPKFGDMSPNKTVHTKATGCTFGTYFGAGYGGNSYSRYAPSNQNNVKNINWNNWLNGQYKQEYNATYGGVSTQFNYQFLPMSDNATNVARILIDFVKFSLATTRNVTSNLTGCTVTGNFYGGGSLGKVDGNVTSTLNNCKVKGSAFGAGFSASLPTVEVDSLGFRTEPFYNENTGTYRTGIKGVTTTYNWEHRDVIGEGIDKTNHILYTTEDLNTLGTVTGKATLNITGNTLVEGFVFDASGNPTTQTGGVFGGGDASAALGDTEVNISASGQKAGSTYNTYNVFGGGNVASVGGSTTVNVNSGIVQNGVYGGCNAQGTIGGNTNVTLTGGTIGSNWSDATPNPLPDRVFGGGLGEPTLVNGNVTVNVGNSDYTGAATIWGNVYGGSALGNTNATKPADALVFDATKKTDVNLYAGTINGNVFGGGLGRKYAAATDEQPEQTAVESFVGGDVNVLLDGAKVHQVFGANNLNGTPKGQVTVHVKRTVGSDKNGETERASRTTYDVAAVYGGGNQADYIPTNATLDSSEDNKTLIENATAKVIVEGCEKTSIDAVYGGGNAAAVPATDVTIKGTYIINNLYGGGNGAGEGNPGANIGTYNNGATAYGTGKAVTKLLGGYINNVYGGSNTKGDVRGGTDVRTKEKTEVVDGDYCTKLNVGNIYGAGSQADVNGNVNIVLECMPEDFVDAVYGGAEKATVNGNVTLTVTSGKYGRVFGGNNEGGDVRGSITVNVYEDGCKPLIIGELYGGGNQAPYSIYGCTKGENVWTANEEGDGEPYFEGNPENRIDVEVNVLSCTSIGQVFGGGRGETAKVIGNTHVYINMMKGIVDNVKRDTIGLIGQVFGGGNLGIVKGNTLIDIGTALAYDGEAKTIENGVKIVSGTQYLDPADGSLDVDIRAGVYGGGNAADVDGDTKLNIGTENLPLDIIIAGDIFGGGLGQKTTVTGDVTVNIGKRTNTATEGDPVYTYEGYATITGDVYGGSAKGKVNATKGGTEETPTFTIKDGKSTQVNLYGGTITGNMYGGGQGESANNFAADVYGPVAVNVYGGNVDKVFGCNNVLGTPKSTVAVAINGGTIDNSVYGGGNQAAYTAPAGSENYPTVTVNNGTITENVFGGGFGLTATVTGNPQVTIGDNAKGHTVAIKKSVYGGGELASVDGSTNIVVNSGTIGTEGEGGPVYGNIYGGGFGSTDDVRIGLVKGNTKVTVNGGSVLHNIYGGGAYGSVGTYTYASGDANAAITAATANTGKASIRILGGTIGTNGHENGMVFGASRGDIAAPGAIQDNMAWVDDTEVIIGMTEAEYNEANWAKEAYGSYENYKANSPQIKGSVYGSGENGHTYHDASVTIHSGMVGITDTSIDGGAAYQYRGNVYGGGCGTDKYYTDPIGVSNPHDGNGNKYNPTAGIVKGNVTVTIDGGHVVRNVYGGGAMGSVTGQTTVNISGTAVIGTEGYGGGEVYAASRGEAGMDDGLATVGSTALNISGGTIFNNAFGGGQLGTVKGSVAVTVSGGTVKNDVYGGGALANTNTDNWNAATNNWSDASTDTYYAEVKHLTKDVSSVDGFYTRSGENEPYTYTPASGKAVENIKYYKKLEGFSKVAANGTTYKTIVSLTGGTIGNAYGGGLGQLTASGESTGEGAVAAMVYGDVEVTVNGTKFTKETERVDGKTIATTGSVFGCNNKNGTPKGSVMVTVVSTKRLDDGDHVKNQFEIQGVYGGGNMAHYTPNESDYDVQTEFGRRTQVLIQGCGDTSIERVYGGGNASDVPFTDVIIEGSFQIGYAFGGGNGGDKINKTGTWIDNPGANVTNYTNVLLKGGTIGEAFGGSDSKGVVGGSDLRRETGECPLVVDNVYGASKEADTDGDVILNLAGCGQGEVAFVFGGSYNANIRGSVTVNISSGIYTSVYGGNDRQGSIGGDITINIEEVDECNPIIIQNLFGGGRRADYPGTGAKKKTGESTYENFTTGNINVNIKAATRIDRVFGGCDNAVANGNTAVNINMVKGSMAGHGFQIPTGYTGDPIPNIQSGDAYAVVYGLTVGTSVVTGYYTRSGSTYTMITEPDTKAAEGVTYYQHLTGIGIIDDAIGTIGDVFGGGNEGGVMGNATVNVCTEEDIAFVNTPAHLTLNGSSKYDVLGAHITGSVYGGGKEGDVTGNTYVNICAKDNSGTYEAVAEGAEKVTIAGNVYGGGKGAADSFTCSKAMVGINDDGATVEGTGESATYTLKEGGTTVTIGHGTISGSVYGGGEVGRVERNTKVSIGFGDGTSGATKSPVIGGYVYGAGQGVSTHGYSGLVRGNSTVTIAGDSWVKHSVYGAGKLASLGRYWIATSQAEATQHNVEIGMPWGLKSGGQSSVTIDGYAVIGPETAMTMPTFDGNVFGGGKGILPYEDVGAEGAGRWYMNGSVYTWESYADASKEEAYIKYVETLGVTNNTEVTIGGNAFVKGSVYGGSENGYLFDGTSVTINGGQIGCGKNATAPYSDDVWAANYTPSTDLECPSWEYTSPYAPYDKFANESGYDSKGGAVSASDGHTFYGNVFGGGSGKDPYKPGKWHQRAGSVGGNAEVNINGGHILTCVYGGNEMTDVKGSCTVKMEGGTLGVPRTLEQIAAHPVTCYLFGAGKGDQRVLFNTWTNVASTKVTVSGGTIYGSVFGGGEDGHVLGNAQVNIGDGAKIGTWGTSYVDGNVFGGGRGFSGEALTAGTVGGNTDVNITGGTMLGSVYGGGRLASVGLFFTDPEDEKYGQLHDDAGGKTYGHITIDISGGTIGGGREGSAADKAAGYCDITHSGNVFGGSMGRLKLLDNTTFNPLWPELAQAKKTAITISGTADIKRNVYGGGEFGTIREDAAVTVSDGTVSGNVFGGGYGNADNEHATPIAVKWNGATKHYVYTPMQWAGMVGGNTTVSVSGGTVAKNVYGGGELASVGIIDYSATENEGGDITAIDGKKYSYANIVKHTDLTKSFALSWPYKFTYVSNKPDSEEKGGKATVTIIGGKIGDASNAESGYVFGGGMGKPMERYTEAFMANVRETEVSIKYTSTATALSDDNCITGAVYGGGENGHVYENSAVNITGGLIGYSVYGGGKGIDKYKATLKNWKDNGATTYETDIYSITAGKVYGNTSVTMSGGHVMRNVYGGGYMASVGKGNYAGGADDYSDFTSEKFGHMSGYGEAIEGNLWTSATVGDGYTAAQRDNAWHFLNSGKATVTITGGTVGTPVGTAEDEFGGLPTGNVIGGSKGEPAPNIFNMPVHEYNPTFHVGNINEAEVIIGDKNNIGVGPRIYASVYGGGQDGHMRRDSKVTIYGGEIGLSSSDISSKYANNGTPANTLQWEHRGNVYGSGSGIGKFEYDYNGNGTTGADQYYEFDSDGDGTAEKHYEVGMSHLAGCVARFSEVNILGGTIHRSVYGGGSVAGTGMPKFYGQNYEPYKKGDTAEGHGQGYQSQNTVTISGGTIGEVGYGGNVFGASRGEAELVAVENPMFATAIWTEVNIKPNATNRANDPVIYGNVYGGGELGSVKKDTKVSLTGGEIKHNAYGGGKGIKADVGAVEANIGGNTTVELNKDVASSAKGCIVNKVFGCNDQNGTPKGHALVHVYATQHKNQLTIGSKYKKFDKLANYTVDNYSTHAFDDKTLSDLAGDVSVDISAYTTTLSSGSASAEEKAAALANMIEAIADKKYDVLAVYGGGDLADYVPDGTEEEAEVIIDGCDLTSIKQVYGGSNAASTPATYVRVNAAYEIHELFGGGNGYDNYELNGKWYQNPGANVGYRAMAHYDTTTPQGAGTKVSPYKAIENDGTGGYADAREPADRRANYAYGLGVTRLEVTGGRIHKSYGGSNENGNIRSEARSAYQEAGVCDMAIDETTGGSKNSKIDARIIADMDCVDFTDKIFGGSTNADVYSDIELNITNGTFGEVYGGNNTSGKIYGSITVNVRENGCKPIIIGELYGGGYLADYSIYGYNNDGSVRTKAEYDDLSDSEKEKIGIKRDPQINVISATRINSIFGGGNQAKVVGSPRVNVNMEKGRIIEKYMTLHPEYATADQTDTRLGEGSTVVWRCEAGGALPIGTIGTVYGGGNLADVWGDTFVEVGTGKHHNSAGVEETITPFRNAATITGNVFGGGKGEAKESGTDAFFCKAAMVGIDGDGVANPAGGTSVTIANGTVGGSVYGGGEIGRVEKNTVVTIGVEGEVADNSKFKPEITGYVFGAGKGVATHGYSALVRGNSTVTIQGKSQVLGSVYGGGEVATVGRYWINDGTSETGKPEVPAGTPAGYPYATRGGGVCTVTVKDDAEIGPDNMVMINTTTGKPDDFGHVFGAGKGATPFDGFKDSKDPWHVDNNNAKVTHTDARTDETAKAAYLEFIETLGLASKTHVTVGGNAFVKGSVYGGAENGYVQTDTHVTIQSDCQIGNGYAQMADDGTYLSALATPVTPIGVNRRYTADEWAQGKLIPVDSDPADLKTLANTYYKSSLPECASWPYQSPFDAHDKFANATGDLDKYSDGNSTEGGRRVASDGHTFYGNVFGGGSGYYPYAPGKWHFKAGSVGGDTYVNITGGHILTSIYGGNEMTNVKGDTHVTFGGTATLGVPRTLGQIAAHPVTCYLFGAGKGDQRVFFNMQTNVKNVNVDVTGGTIYGSVFGGGEDGHVLGSVTMNIGTAAEGTEGQDGYVAAAGPTIGTWGTSYVEGNVFGGGRGFAGDALTAGVVCGNVDMNIYGGTMLGSIYGGGRLGSIGTHLEPSDNANYGKLIPDDRDEDYETGAEYTHSGSTHGYVTINISGGTIGNNKEYIIPQAGNIPDGLGADPKNWTSANWTTWKTANNVPNTDYVYDEDLDVYRLTHTKGGNVFAGAMGRMYALDGTTPLTRWYDLGMVRSTRLTITGGTIKSNVYGGGELGWTAGKHKHSNTALTATDSLSTEILIQGGTIGTEVKEAGDVTRYTFGSVYGGGYGNATEKLSDDTNPKFIAGRVVGGTSVKMEDGQVKGSIYGGGEVANVGLGFYSYKSTIIGGTKGGFTKDDSGIAKTDETITATDIAKVSTYVDVSGGTVGIAPVAISENLTRHFGGATMGNVYGGGSGNRTIVRCGLVLGNSSVRISQAEGKTTRIYHNVYGGGSFGSVGDYKYESQEDPVIHTEKVYGVQAMHTAGTGEATVSITGGTIGSNGHENGMVFGSSRGDIINPHSRDNYMAWVNNATVTIGTKGGTYATPTVKGSVYGSGENGHTFGNTVVTVNSGTVGVSSVDLVVVPDPDDPSKTTTYYGANYPFRGNVYGGGCGTDTYKENGEEKYNPEAGIVRGNTTVNINGGLIAHSVYGAGSMGSVGTITNLNDTTAVSTGGTGLARHADETNGFALSWPYEFTFADNTGKATVNINGGHIGVQLTDGNIEIKGDGDVYGSARGEAGDRYKTAHFAYVREAEVNVNFPDTCTATFANYSTDLGKWCVTGSVHGSGENGYVYGDTHVTLNKGLVGHSLYGAGKGNGTYKRKLLKIGVDPDKEPKAESDYYTADIYSLIAGRVMGNTYVTMNDGHVGRNVYGGGNLGSVGKGNFASGADDYFPTGYGEKITGNLWTSATKGDDAWHFLNSGKTTVKILGGTVGSISTATKNGLPYGNVFGGSAGEAAPNVPASLSPRYEYCPAFYSGYVNETDVTIGKAATPAVGKEGASGYVPAVAASGPRIYGSVYGGGQDGHVRRDTKITMYAGEIGLPYTSENQTALGTTDLNNIQWLHRGNIYGAGSGITEYKFDFDGDGNIQTEGEVTVADGTKYTEQGYSTSSGSVTRFTEVNVLGGTVHRNVYGGGSMGSVGAPAIPPTRTETPYKKDVTTRDAAYGGGTIGAGWWSQNTVTIGGGDGKVYIGTPTDYNKKYGGEVYGACRGLSTLDPNQFANSVWTLVKILDGADIKGNVYGGGDSGIVKRDSEVKIGR